MTMGEKHLRELLNEDQEPFLLKHYISERRRQLKRPSPNTSLLLQLKKKPQQQNNFPLNKCFLSSLTKSPLLEFASPNKSPLTIQKNSKPNKVLALFGSLFKKLTSPKREIIDLKKNSLKDEVVGSCEVGFTPTTAILSETKQQDKEINGGDGATKFQSEEEQEDKEQCSPVSVLDAPFNDDDDENDHDGGHGFDLHCSYSHVQRTKKHLLDRLRRFEKLAELDPIELEKSMLDQEECEYETFMKEDDYDDAGSETSEENALREKVFEILCYASVQDIQQTPEDLKRLVYDLIKEEETEFNSSQESNMVIKRVCRRLELWKEVEPNTIDMMIEEDFSREEGRAKKNSDPTRDLAEELELAILGLLVDELSEELVC